MSTKKIVQILAPITALSLLLLTTTAYALSPGITTLENNNHDYQLDESGNYVGTDTVDYCLWANDVQITISALEKLMASGEETFKAELEEASQYSFLIRGSSYQPVTEGYEVDISKICAEVTDEGYPVTVTLPSITEGVVSAITYRVYVVADPYTPPDDYKGYVENGDISIYYTNTLTVFASQWKAWGMDNTQDDAITEMLRYEAVNQSSGMLVNAACKATISDYIMDLPEYPAIFTAVATFTTESGETATGDIVITVVEDPTPVIYTLTIRYVDGKGREVQNAYVAQYQSGAEYDISSEVQLSISGYTQSNIEGNLTGIISSDVEVVVTYKKNAVPLHPSDDEDYSYYCVTVGYVDKDTGENLLDSYRSGSIREGQRYDVSNQANVAIDGYSMVEISGETDGQITQDVVVTVYYVADKDETVPPGTEDAPDDTTGDPVQGEDVAAPITPEQPQSPDIPNTPTQDASSNQPVDTTGDPVQGEDVAAPITPEQPQSPDIPNTPTQDASSNQPVDTSPVSDKGTNRTAVDHSNIPIRDIGDDANHSISEVQEEHETSIIPVKPIVPSIENVIKPQIDNAVENTTVSMKGWSVLELILTGLSSAAVAVFGGSIMSDIRVLRWYEERKKRVIRL